jgi:hypothetical protein
VPALAQTELWRQPARSWRFALLLVAIALALVRSRDQPSLDLHLAGTTVSIVPLDAALVALAVVALATLVRAGVPREAWPALAAAAAFCVVILATAAANGGAAFVAAGKLVELAALGLGCVALVVSRERLEAVAELLIAFTLVADAVALVEFVRGGGGRQPSFLGEHDFAALATMPLVYGLALAFERRASARAWIAIAAGGLGVALGAALASLVGLYLGALALVVVATARHALRVRPVVVTAATLVAVTAATFSLRSGDLGFLQSWFGKPPERPGQYAAGWSQRLIYAYLGGRVFLDRPVLGTGWWGNLPADEFAQYLPDARRRFSDQPARYFPRRDGVLVPQQAYDQVLYETGLVGGAALLALLAALTARAVAAARRAAGRLAFLPAVWLAAAAGALAGEGLFGGTPLAAVFWLTAGLVVAIPFLAR